MARLFSMFRIAIRISRIYSDSDVLIAVFRIDQLKIQRTISVPYSFFRPMKIEDLENPNNIFFTSIMDSRIKQQLSPPLFLDKTGNDIENIFVNLS